MRTRWSRCARVISSAAPSVSGASSAGCATRPKKGLLSVSVHPRIAAVGLHALVDGLITNWVLDPKYVALARTAAPLIDSYLDGLKAAATRKPRQQKKARR